MGGQMAEKRLVEVISVRLSTPDHKQAVLDTFRQVKTQISNESNLSKRTELYNNTKNGTDWSIYLHWKKPEQGQNKTLLGISIAEAFSSLGLVNHTVMAKKS